MTSEIPVLVNNRLRWITGVTRKTTCEEVIAMVLRNMKTPSDDVQGYVLMEQWRRVERPLDGKARILKLWNAWGDEKECVRFVFKKTDWDADSGRGSPSKDSNSTQRRKHRSHNHHRRSKPPWPPHETLHPKRLAQLHEQLSQFPNHKLPQSIERLMKLILAQGETIQSQLRRLHDREYQIEKIEDDTHRARVETLGSNYLLETYLGNSKIHPESGTPLQDDEEEEKGNDSGVVTEGGSDQTPPTLSPSEGSEKRRSCEEDNGHLADESGEDEVKNIPDVDEATINELKTKVELWEKIVKVNKKLEKEEESLVRLHIKLRKHYLEIQSDRGDHREDNAFDEESYHIRNNLLGDLEKANVDTEKFNKELENTSLALAETEVLLDARRHYLKRLQGELEASDRETDWLQKKIELCKHQISNVPDKVIRRIKNVRFCEPNSKPSCSVGNTDTDSNSDTGLSSLHSSSEEGVYVLDTLV